MDRPKLPPRPAKALKPKVTPREGALEPTAESGDVTADAPETVGRSLLRAARLLDDLLVARLVAKSSEARASHTRLLPFVDPEGTRLTTLAARTGVTKQAVGQLVEELEAQGLLAREADPEDGRAKRVKLLPRGKKALADTLTTLATLEAGLEEKLGPARLEALSGTLVDALAWLEAESAKG